MRPRLDIVAATVDYLDSLLGDYPDGPVWVTGAKSESDPLQIVIRNDGGMLMSDMVRASIRLGINIYAPTRSAAVDLAAMVTALINAWADGQPVITATASLSHEIAEIGGSRQYLTAELTVLV